MLLIESFRSYADTTALLRTWDNQQNPANLTLLSPGLRVNGSVVTYCGFTFPYALNKIHLGFHLTVKQLHGGTSNLSLLHINWNGTSNTANQVGLAINSSGNLIVFRGDNVGGLGGTTLATGATALAVDTEYWIEFDLNLGTALTADGSFELRIGDVVEVSGTNVQTDERGSALVSFMQFAAGFANSSENIFEFRDVLVDDCLEGVTTWYGEQVIEYCTPTSDAATAFVPSSGVSNFPLVVAPNASPTTDYVGTSTVDAEDRYGHSGISFDAADIPYVQARVTTLANGAGVKALQPRIRVGAAYHDEKPARLITSALGDWRTGFKVQPNGDPWTKAVINAAEIGFATVPYLKGWDFRSTAVYVTDPAHCTYGIATDLYPVTRNGATFGWDVAPTISLNRTVSADVRTSGVAAQENLGTQRNFRIDLPVAGWYQVRLQLGDRNFEHNPVYAAIYDDATLKVTLNNVPGNGIAQWNDAGYDLGTRAMPGDATPSEAQISGSYARWINFSSTTFYLRIGTPTVESAGEFSCIAHLELMSFEDGAGTAAPEARVSQLALEVLRGTVEANQPPVVNAGPNQTINFPAGAFTLAGSATDPEGGALTYLWSVVSSPPGSSVNFTDATDPTTNGYVDMEGVYVLRLTASDGSLTGTADVTLTTQAVDPLGYPLPYPVQLFDNDGHPATGYLLYSYVAGTTTPLATYANRRLTVKHANPIVLDGGGRETVYVPDGVSYKFVMTDTDGVEVWSRDHWSVPDTEGVTAAATADVPTGAITPCGLSSPPSGWLFCDGAAVSRTDYADLFDVIGTTFGNGNGSTTFNLPDMRGRFPFGVAASGTGSSLGDEFGAVDHVHTGPSHTHEILSHTHTLTHTHTVPFSAWTTQENTPPLAGILQAGGSGVGSEGVVTQANANNTTGASGAATTGGTALETAESGSANTGAANPPGLALNFIIKT